MDVNTINSAARTMVSEQPTQSKDDTLQKAAAAVRFLNTTGSADREFSVSRDPDTHKFVIMVRDRSTGTLIDQFPPEDILKMVSQMDTTTPKGDQTE